MGLSNFFDNFMGGFAFGMLASNPFTSGMFYNPFMCGGYYSNRVDFETFANPFPNVFGNVGYSYAQTPQMPSTFANSGFPSIDFSGIQQSIWDFVSDPQTAYNKQMKAYQDQIAQIQKEQEARQNQYQYQSNPYYYPQMSMPFWSNFYTPYLYQPQPVNPEKKEGDSVKTDDSVSLEPEDTDSKKVANVKISQSASELKSKWSKKQPQLSDEFYNKVISISQKVKCSPDDLMALMNLETVGTFSPSKKNPLQNSTATGLIQFTEATAKNLGTTTAKLAKMTAENQLDYVEKYLVLWKNENFSDEHVLSAGELYALVAQPANAKKDVLIRNGTKEYDQNAKSWDLNKDGAITKTELGKALDSYRA